VFWQTRVPKVPDRLERKAAKGSESLIAGSNLLISVWQLNERNSMRSPEQ